MYHTSYSSVAIKEGLILVHIIQIFTIQRFGGRNYSASHNTLFIGMLYVQTALQMKCNITQNIMFDLTSFPT